VKFLAELQKVPLPRLIIIWSLTIGSLAAFEHMPWSQSVLEFLLNMEGTLK